MTAPAAILLHPDDNVVVCCRDVVAGERVEVESSAFIARSDVALGHKIALRRIEQGAKVIKYGMPIGSMTATAEAGDWVHLHNMKSDYISAHLRGSTEQST